MTPRDPKRQRHFQKVEEYKERFRKESSEVLRKRTTMVPLIKEAAIAIREILEERQRAADAD